MSSQAPEPGSPRRPARIRPLHALAVAVLLVVVGLYLRRDWAPPPGTTVSRAAGVAATGASSANPPEGSTRGPLSGQYLPVAPPLKVDSVSPTMPPWNVARLQAALASLGIGTVAVAAPIHQSFMGVPGTILRLMQAGRPVGDAQVFVYADAVSRGRDTDRLDSVRVSPRAAAIQWQYPPALVTSSNLAIVVLTSDPAVRATVRKAVSAPPRVQ